MGKWKDIWVVAGRDGYCIGDETMEVMEETSDVCKKTDCHVSVILSLRDEIDEVHVIGDAAAPRNLMQAIGDGFKLGHRI